MLCTIGISAAHRFGEYMQIGRGVVTHCANVITFEDIQHLN